MMGLAARKGGQSRIEASFYMFAPPWGRWGPPKQLGRRGALLLGLVDRKGGQSRIEASFYMVAPPWGRQQVPELGRSRELVVLGVVGTRGQCPSSPVAGRVDVRSRVIAVLHFRVGGRPKTHPS